MGKNARTMKRRSREGRSVQFELVKQCVLHRAVGLALNLKSAFVPFIKMWSAVNPNMPYRAELNTQELMSLLGLILHSQYQPGGIQSRS